MLKKVEKYAVYWGSIRVMCLCTIRRSFHALPEHEKRPICNAAELYKHSKYVGHFSFWVALHIAPYERDQKRV